MLLHARDSVLLVVDMQERLLPAISDAAGVTRRVAMLLRVAGRLDVPVLMTEQYPRGLGATVEAVRAEAPDAPVIEKLDFAATRASGFSAHLSGLRRHQVIVCGAETHVCVLQTAAGVASAGFETVVAADACGSRRDSDKQAALARLDRAGVATVTSEMVAFEWLERAGSDVFRDVIELIK